MPLGNKLGVSPRLSSLPSNSGAVRPFTVVIPGRADAVAWTALLPAMDLSRQHPTVLLAGAPEQVDEAYIVEESAPSSQSRMLLLSRVAG